MDGVIRGEWCVAVAGRCQVTVGALIDAEPETFEEAIKSLAGSLPPPSSAAETQFLHDRLAAFSHSAGRHLHRTFHARVPRVACAALELEETYAMWGDSARHTHTEPAALLTRWAGEFRERFERTHRWPPAWRAVGILKRNLASPPTRAALARTLGCSPSTLKRGVKKQLGTRMDAFLQGLRAQEAIRLLSETSWSVETIARTVGFRSTKNLYPAIRNATGLTPDGVRRQARASRAK